MRLGLWVVLTLLVFFSSTSSFAGVSESLSTTASVVTGKICPSYDEKKLNSALKKAATHSACGNNSNVLGNEQEKQLAQISTLLQGDAEDQYFALLAEQQSKELICATDYAMSISEKNDESDEIKQLTTKLKLARAVKQNLAKASQELATNPNISDRVCPEDFEMLQKDYPQEKQKDPSFLLCKDIIANRQAYQAIVSSIPLWGVPTLREMIEKFSSSKNEITESAVGNTLRSGYKKAASALRDSQTKLADALKKGGAGFDREARRALIKDVSLNKAILTQNPSDDMVALSCQADSRYGSGADKLDNFVFAGTLLLGGVVGQTAKAVSIANRAATTATAFRNTQLLMTLQKASIATSFATAASTAQSACTDHAIADFKETNACVIAPSVESVEQDNCLLVATMSAAGFAAIAPKALLMELAGRTKGAIKNQLIFFLENAGARTDPLERMLRNRAMGKTTAAPTFPKGAAAGEAGVKKAQELRKNKNTLSDRFEKARSTQDKAEIARLNKEAETALSEGTIVSSTPIGHGQFNGQYVVFEDGTEGVWKPNVFWRGTANREVMAYEVDQYLGMNAVPTTVMKKYKGKSGSVQLRVTSLRDDAIPETQPNETGAFDYLITNFDRHAGNSLQAADGSLVAIDHGLSMAASVDMQNVYLLRKFKENVQKLHSTTQQRVNLEKTLTVNDTKTLEEIKTLKNVESAIQLQINSFVPQKDVIEKLRQTSQQDWVRVIGRYVGRKDIAGLVERQKTLLKELDKAESLIGADKLYPGGPSSPVLRKKSDAEAFIKNMFAKPREQAPPTHPSEKKLEEKAP